MTRLLPLVLVLVLLSATMANAQQGLMADAQGGLMADAQGGRLRTIVQDTRTPPPPSAPAAAAEPSRDDHHDDPCWSNIDGDDDGSIRDTLWLLGSIAVGTAITSPVWIPHNAVGDSFAVPGYFPRFPYDDASGYMILDSSSLGGGVNIEAWKEYGGGADYIETRPLLSNRTRTWAARFRVDYADDFRDMQQIAGHLLLSTSSRFGLDTGMSFLEERRGDGGRDQLWLGDCNFVWRFAQSERTQWRTGIGFNWLDDPARTDFGFNFTYGLDFFPAEPWVASATLDWGKLGHADLFHFRTTIGVVIHGVEAYTGYEYYDIGRTQVSSLVSGVRIWF